MAAKAFGHQVVTIEVVFIVAIGMHASHLGENMRSHHGSVRSDRYPAMSLYQTTYGIKGFFVDVGLGMEHVFQDYLHGSQRGIATSLTKSVDCDVESIGATKHGRQRIAHRQVIIVVGMEIEVQIGITLTHLPHILHTLQGIEYAQRIGKQEATDARVA